MCNFCNFSQVHIFPFIVHFASTLLCSFNIFTNIHANLKNKIIKSSFSLFFYYYFLFYLILFFFYFILFETKANFTLCIHFMFLLYFYLYVFCEFFHFYCFAYQSKDLKAKVQQKLFFLVYSNLLHVIYNCLFLAEISPNCTKLLDSIFLYTLNTTFLQFILQFLIIFKDQSTFIMSSSNFF